MAVQAVLVVPVTLQAFIYPQARKPPLVSADSWLHHIYRAEYLFACLVVYQRRARRKLGPVDEYLRNAVADPWSL